MRYQCLQCPPGSYIIDSSAAGVFCSRCKNPLFEDIADSVKTKTKAVGTTSYIDFTYKLKCETCGEGVNISDMPAHSEIHRIARALQSDARVSGSVTSSQVSGVLPSQTYRCPVCNCVLPSGFADQHLEAHRIETAARLGAVEAELLHKHARRIAAAAVAARVPSLAPSSAASASASSVPTSPLSKRRNDGGHEIGFVGLSTSSMLSNPSHVTAAPDPLSAARSQMPWAPPALVSGSPLTVSTSNIARPPLVSHGASPLGVSLSLTALPAAASATTCPSPSVARKGAGYRKSDQIKCCYCRKEFTEKQEKELHERLHIEAITSQQFQCLKCSEKFDTNEKIMRHYQTLGHTPQDRKDKSTLYACNRCRARFESPAQACRHLFSLSYQRFHDPLVSQSMLGLGGIQQFSDGRFGCGLKGCNFIGCSQEVFQHMHDMQHPGRTLESCYATKI